MINTDAVYLKYADEYKNLMEAVNRSFIGKRAQIENYNVAINGRTGTITNIRLIEGNFYFHLDDQGFSFEPQYLRLIEN